MRTCWYLPRSCRPQETVVWKVRAKAVVRVRVLYTCAMETNENGGVLSCSWIGSGVVWRWSCRVFCASACFNRWYMRPNHGVDVGTGKAAYFRKWRRRRVSCRICPKYLQIPRFPRQSPFVKFDAACYTGFQRAPVRDPMARYGRWFSCFGPWYPRRRTDWTYVG